MLYDFGILGNVAERYISIDVENVKIHILDMFNVIFFSRELE